MTRHPFQREGPDFQQIKLQVKSCCCASKLGRNLGSVGWLIGNLFSIVLVQARPPRQAGKRRLTGSHLFRYRSYLLLL